MSYLYIKNGYKVKNHSYSAGSDFRQCKRLYKLKRVDGWKEKEDRASMEFGNCIEASVQFYHEQSNTDHVMRFHQLWSQVDKSRTFSEKEGSWEDLDRVGEELLRLYAIQAPHLPIVNPRFQINYKKEVFPGTDLAGINHTSYIDMLSSPESGQIIIDIKTSSMRLNDSPKLLRLDPQLREYAWTTGIERVGFLWFVKKKPTEYKRGDYVTFLGGGSREIRFSPGDSVVVMGSDENSVYVLPEENYLNYELSAKGLKGKKLEELKSEYISYSAFFTSNQLTKQELQFQTVTMRPDDKEEAGYVIGQDIADIVHARETGKYPQEPGIRFPNAKCPMCPMRGLCMGDDRLVKELLVAPKGFVTGAPPSEKDWMDELLED